MRGTSANAALAPPTSQGSVDPTGILPPFLQTRVAAAAAGPTGRKRLREWDLSLSRTLASVWNQWSQSRVVWEEWGKGPLIRKHCLIEKVGQGSPWGRSQNHA